MGKVLPFPARPRSRLKPHVYSASQLSTFALCQRKWGWEYLAGHREPPGAAAELGQRVHKVLEKWLKEGKPPNKRTIEGKIAAAGLDELPLPSARLQVEKGFQHRIGKFNYRGYVDLQFKTKKSPWIIDHKTTSDFIWQKTEDDLKTDIQAILYARIAFDKIPDAEHINLKWVYYRTRNPAVRKTKIKLSREYVGKQFLEIEALAKKAERLRLTVVDPLKIPPTLSACSAYGGCPHIKRCNLKPIDRIKAIMAQGEKKQSMLEKMKARNKERSSTKKKVTRKPEFNPPEQPDEEEALSTEAADVPISRKKTTAKRTAKKAPPSRRRRDEEDEDEELEEDIEDEEEDIEDEDEEEKPRRGRPKGSKNSKSSSSEPDARTKQLVWAMLHAGALAGGGSAELIKKAEKLFEEFNS